MEYTASAKHLVRLQQRPQLRVLPQPSLSVVLMSEHEPQVAWVRTEVPMGAPPTVSPNRRAVHKARYGDAVKLLDDMPRAVFRFFSAASHPLVAVARIAARKPLVANRVTHRPGRVARKRLADPRVESS